MRAFLLGSLYGLSLLVGSCGTPPSIPMRPGVVEVRGNPWEIEVLSLVLTEFQVNCRIAKVSRDKCQVPVNTTLTLQFAEGEALTSRVRNTQAGPKIPKGYSVGGLCESQRWVTPRGEVTKATRQVFISNEFKALSPEAFKSVVYHELGHCLLGRDDVHNEDSIMHLTTSGNCGGLDVGEDWPIIWMNCKKELFR